MNGEGSVVGLVLSDRTYFHVNTCSQYSCVRRQEYPFIYPYFDDSVSDIH